jgi:hypothetical protein
MGDLCDTKSERRTGKNIVGNMLIHKQFLKPRQEKNPHFLPPIGRPIRASFPGSDFMALRGRQGLTADSIAGSFSCLLARHGL